MGEWLRTTYEAVAADPASEAFPTGYIIPNVADVNLKHDARGGGMGGSGRGGETSKVGVLGATPTKTPATDLDSIITLANELGQR